MYIFIYTVNDGGQTQPTRLANLLTKGVQLIKYAATPTTPPMDLHFSTIFLRLNLLAILLFTAINTFLLNNFKLPKA